MAGAFYAGQPDYIAQLNLLGTAADFASYAAIAASLAAGIIATSTTSFTIGTGSKAFTTQSGKQFTANQFATIVSASNTNNWMFGQITAYSGTTLTINVTQFNGSGASTDWGISLSGVAGPIGPVGPGSTIIVQDEGTTLTTNVSTLNFVGAEVTATNVGNVVTVTIPAITWSTPGTIGSTTPNTAAFTTLSTTGVTTLQTGNAGTPSIVFNGSATTGMYRPAADQWGWSVTGTAAMLLTASTLDLLSSVARLRILPAVATNSALTQFQNTGGTAYVGLDSSTGGLGAVYALNLYHGGAFPIVFSTSGTEQSRIDSSGNFGIGTNSPSSYAKLAVLSGSSAKVAQFVSTDATAYATGSAISTFRLRLAGGSATGSHNGIQFSGSGGTCEGYFGLVQNASGTGEFVWQGYSGSAYVERMRLDAASNLTISGIVNSSGQLNANNVSGNIRLKADGTSAKDGALYVDATGLISLAHWAGSPVISISPSGNALIKTSIDDGTSALQVNGATSITGNFATTGVAAIGGVSQSNIGFRVMNTALTGVSQYFCSVEGASTSTATSQTVAYLGNINTTASAYTTIDRIQFYAVPPTKGSGSTITNDTCFWASATTQGTNNFGYKGLIASGTNNYNLYMSGTAQNYLAGNTGHGQLPSSAALVTVGGSSLTNTTQYGVLSQPTGTSAGTSALIAMYAIGNSAAAAYTVGSIYGLYIDTHTKGAGSTITSSFGINVQDQTQGTNNYGLVLGVSSGANKYNIYANGTADNVWAGNTRFGSVSAPVATVDITGTLAMTSNAAIGGSIATNVALNVVNTNLSGTNQYAVQAHLTSTSAATAQTVGILGNVTTAAAAYTTINRIQFLSSAPAKGAGSTITNDMGFYVDDSSQSTYTYGFYGNIASGSNKWNIYANGTAVNYFAGNTGVGINVPAFSTSFTGLHVHNPAASQGAQIRLTNAGTGATNTDGLGISSDAAGVAYVWNYETQALSFGVGGVESARLSSGGKFIIGGTADNGVDQLQINGTGCVTGAGSNNAFLLKTTNANTAARNWAIVANQQAYGDFTIMQGSTIGGDPVSLGSNRMYFSAAGRMLVNSIADNNTDQFQVSGSIFSTLYNASSSANADTQYLAIRNTSTGTSAAATIALGNNGSANAAYIQVYGGNHATLPAILDINNRNSAAVRILSNNALVASFAPTGLAITGVLTATGLATLSSGASFTGTTVPTIGASIEIIHNGSTIGTIRSYNRTTPAYAVLNFEGSTVGLRPSGSDVLIASSTGIVVTGVASITKATAGSSLSWTNGGTTPKTGFLYSGANAVGMFDDTGGAGNGFYIYQGAHCYTQIANVNVLDVSAGSVAVTGVHPVTANNLAGSAISARFSASLSKIGFNFENNGGSNNAYLGYNCNSVVSANIPTYDIADYASRITMGNGQFRFENTSVAGTAGANIAFNVLATMDTNGLNVSNINATNANITSLFDADNNLIISSVNPMIASGFGTSPTIIANNTAAFKITIGSSPTGIGAITLPSAPHGWVVTAVNITSNSTITVSQTAFSSTSASLAAYSRTTGLAVNFNASDVILLQATAF